MNIREVYFETYGCTANYNSSEIMAGLLKQAGLNITQNEEFADLIVINSCIVKEPTQEKIRRRVQDLLEGIKKGNKKQIVILTGCMPRLNKNLFQEYHGRELFFLDIHHIKEIVNLIEDILSNNYDSEKYLKLKNEVKCDLPKLSKEKLIGITQISEGCLGECNYCIVRLAKGKLFSYPKEKILSSIERDLGCGCKEIWLTSQDNASYGNEEGEYNLVELLKEIIEIKTPREFYVRVGMMNPNNVLRILPELIEIYKNPKIFKFLHLPIQSGSNKILKEMNRFYSREDVLKIVNFFKKEFPEITIATDIIVGYPGESEKDFKETLDLIKEIKPEILNRSNFYPRPHTPAEKLKQIPTEIMNKRAKELQDLHLEICKDIQEKWLNKTVRVFVDQKGFGSTYLARTQEYKLVAVQSNDKSILGKTIIVNIKKVMPHYLLGLGIV